MKKQALHDVTTVGEALETVLEFDRAAHRFYEALIPQVSKNIRYIVAKLAKDELAHVRMLKTLMETQDTIAHMRDRIDRPHADHKFSEAISTPDLGDDPDDQAVLQYALAREEIAIAEYTELAEATPPGPLHDAFQFLANEERAHKVEIEKLYYEIVHSGGV